MGFSNWICSKNSKNMFVKIVHPGGHVELHDKPILAAEIIYRNPRSVVAYPHVFRQPWAIVKPETELMLGQKFYVVPVSTIRKLQRVAKKQSRSSTLSPVCQTPPTSKSSQKSQELQDPEDSDIDDGSSCFSDKNCFKCMKRKCVKSRRDDIGGDDCREEKTGHAKGSPAKRHAEVDQWQRSLASITETDHQE